MEDQRGPVLVSIKTDDELHWPDAKTMSREDFVKLIQPEITAFEKDFVGLGQSPLLVVETTMLRTYLAWKLRGLK